MKVERYPAGRIQCKGVMFTEDEQREIILSIWKTTPKLIRDIVCESCPEALGSVW